MLDERISLVLCSKLDNWSSCYLTFHHFYLFTCYVSGDFKRFAKTYNVSKILLANLLKCFRYEYCNDRFQEQIGLKFLSFMMILWNAVVLPTLWPYLAFSQTFLVYVPPRFSSDQQTFVVEKLKHKTSARTQTFYGFVLNLELPFNTFNFKPESLYSLSANFTKFVNFRKIIQAKPRMWGSYEHRRKTGWQVTQKMLRKKTNFSMFFEIKFYNKLYGQKIIKLINSLLN